MLKKIYLLGFTIILSITLFGCNTPSDQLDDSNEDIPKEQDTGEKSQENNPKESSIPNNTEQDESGLELHTGSTETVMRTVEGMEEERTVINYKIHPYDISYQLDESFDTPEVNDKQIIYSDQNDEYQIKVELIEQTMLEEAVSDLQESFVTEDFEHKGELESISEEENNLQGKMQTFAYPMIQGFYVYQIEEHVLAITYQYPVEAGDGMGPLLSALRTSIQVQ